MQKERKKKWDEQNQEAIANGVKKLDEFDKVANPASCFFYSQSSMMNVLITCNAFAFGLGVSNNPTYKMSRRFAKIYVHHLNFLNCAVLNNFH